MQGKTPQLILLVGGGLLLAGSVILYSVRSSSYHSYFDGPLYFSDVLTREPKKYSFDDEPIATNYYPTALIGAIAVIAGVATWNLAGGKKAK